VFTSPEALREAVAEFIEFYGRFGFCHGFISSVLAICLGSETRPPGTLLSRASLRS
jgi:hypothetical protein